MNTIISPLVNEFSQVKLENQFKQKMRNLNDSEQHIVLTILKEFKHKEASFREETADWLKVAREWKETSSHLEKKVLDIVKSIFCDSEKKTITQEELTQLLKELPKIKTENSRNVVLADLLKERGYSTELKNIDFAIPEVTVNPQTLAGAGTPIEPWLATDLLTAIDFSNLTLLNCNFRYTNLSHSIFNNCLIKECNLQEAILQKASLTHSTIEHTLLTTTMAPQSIWKEVTIKNCDASYMNFYQAHLNRVIFTENEMQGTNFFAAKVENSSLNGVQGSPLLFETKDKFISAQPLSFLVEEPIVILPWNVTQAGICALRVDHALKREGGIPLRFNYLPDIDTEKLNKEVLHLIETIRRSKKKIKSLPMEILQQVEEKPHQYPLIQNLKKTAESLAIHCNALVLPGGADIQPIFYGEVQHEKTKPDPDFRRSIFEFALLFEANKRGLPVLSICRGSQLSNIYYGGSLEQHVKGHLFVVQKNSPTPETGKGAGVVRGLMKGQEVMGYAFHHQAYKKIGEGLELVAKHEDSCVPKALEKDTGAPQVAVQWHPEFKGDKETEEAKLFDPELSEANKEFFSFIVKAGKAFKAKQQALERIKKV